MSSFRNAVLGVLAAFLLGAVGFGVRCPAAPATPDPVQTLTKFDSPAAWSMILPDGVAADAGSTPGTSGMMRITWKTAQTSAVHPTSADFALKQPIPLPNAALRAGLWLYIERPIALSNLWLTLRDSEGARFRYTLTVPGSWERGWQYIDTYPFLANEGGHLHPTVGAALDAAHPLPVGRVTLTGIEMQAKTSVSGVWWLGAIQSDASNLSDGSYCWTTTEPQTQYWTAPWLLRSGEPPALLTDQVLPDSGSAMVDWRVTAGYEGPLVDQGSKQLDISPDDLAAQAERLPLGNLPTGNYKVVVDVHPPADQLTPDDWQSLDWHATGESLWDDTQAHGGKRSLTGKKTDGTGYVGWRQSKPAPAPGAYHLHLFEKGTAPAYAQVTLLDAQKHSLPNPLVLRFQPSATWQEQQGDIKIGADAVSMYVDVAASGDGAASFDDISLTQGSTDAIDNGAAESGALYHRLKFDLQVARSPIASQPLDRQPISVPLGQSVPIPLPAWPVGTWQITDSSGSVLKSGVVHGTTLVWQPPHAGVFNFQALQMNGAAVVDEYSRAIGCETPEAQIGSDRFALAQTAPTYNDLFGPGKLYASWATWDMNYRDPDYYPDFVKWVAAGRAAGFTLFRVRADWDAVEPLPGVYDFSLVDKCVRAVEQQGGTVSICPRLSPPAWLDLQPQLDSDGRPDTWKHDQGPFISDLWSPGMLGEVKQFVVAVAQHYRNDPKLADYHFFGLPGGVDWTFVDRPWLGEVTDYSPYAVAKFREWTNGKYDSAPSPILSDWNRPDLRPEWRAWTEFKIHDADTFFIDGVMTPLRAMDNRRPVTAYYGLDYASKRLVNSARTQNWIRHEGGVELYYQTPMELSGMMLATGKMPPSEVNQLTPTQGNLEQATWQLTNYGGQGLQWNYYWKVNEEPGHWAPPLDNGLTDWENRWKPLWQTLRDAVPAQPIDMACVRTWSTMNYMDRTFFPLRLGDYATAPAALLTREHLFAYWFTENADLGFLKTQKLVIVPPTAATVMPSDFADGLASYVYQGGHIAIFADGGEWAYDKPDQRDYLLRSVGWQGDLPRNTRQGASDDAGNSGLPQAANASGPYLASAVPGQTTMDLPASLAFAGRIALQSDQPGRGVISRFADGSPAVITWPYGKGQVVWLAGWPDWSSDSGLFTVLYRWAGGSPSVGASDPSILVNDLVKGSTHYIILHRAPAGLDPRSVSFPQFYRTVERSYPAMTGTFSVYHLPPGRWHLRDLTDASKDIGVYTSAQLAKGIPTTLFLAQTQVIEMTPEP